MGVARSALWAPDRAGGHFHGRNSMSYLSGAYHIFEKTAERVLSQGRIQGEGAGGAHPPPWDDLRPLSN